jgi:hypothetical protein
VTLYLNKKERVYDLKLTAYGKYLLSIGSFKPTYYAFFDDNIIYDGRYAQLSESQNDPVYRIQNETHFHESLVLFEDIDAVPSNNKGEGINYFDLDVTPTKEVPRKDTFKYDSAIGDAHYDGVNPNYAPAWKVVALNGLVTDSGTKDYINNLNIPQVNVELNYQKRTVPSKIDAPPIGTPTEANIPDFATATEPFLDNRAIELAMDDAAIYVEELNTTMLVNNFDIEVFEMQIEPCTPSSGSIRLIALPEEDDHVLLNNGKEVFKYTFKNTEDAWGNNMDASNKTNSHSRGTRLKRNVSIAAKSPEQYTDDLQITATLYNLLAAINETTNANLHATAAGNIPAIIIENRNCDSYGLYGPVTILNRDIIASNASRFTVAGFAGAKVRKETLRRKFFEKEMPQVVDGFMVSETPTLKQHDTLPSSSVEYYFDINVDHEADKEDICKHAEVLNRESYYIDLDFDCEVERDDDLYYYDIYGTEGEPEICLD